MNSFRWQLAVLVIGAFALLACSSTGPGASSEPRQIDMTLRKGMTISEVDSLYGSPNSIDEKVMGTKTNAAWEGIVWKYRMDLDPAYTHAIRYLTNTLIFTKSTSPPTLVYWDIEQLPEPNGKKR